MVPPLSLPTSVGLGATRSGGLLRAVGEARKGRKDGANTGWTDDLALKIDRLHERLSQRDETGESLISRALRKFPDFRPLSNDQYAEECDSVVHGSSKWIKNHTDGVAFDKLRDIKLLFDRGSLSTQGEQGGGFSEEEFVRIFAPVFCPDQDPNQVKFWFMGIDQDANGIIDWDEFSSYLMKTQHQGADPEPGRAKLYIQKGVEPETPPAAPLPINRIVHNHHLNVYYSAAADGTVRMWDGVTLEERGVVHYGEGCTVHSLHYLPETKRLVVGQFDRLTFIYTCGPRRSDSAGHKLQRVFKGDMVHKGNVNKVNSIHKIVEYDPDSMIMENTLGTQHFTQVMRGTDGRADPTKMQNAPTSRVGRYRVDVVLMDELNRNVQCMGPMHRIYPEKADPWILGVEEGVIFLYNFSLRDDPAGSGHSAITVQHLEPGQNIRPLERWQPHTDWVTHVLAAPALQGFISSSMDSSIQVLDVQKNNSYLRMEVEPEPGAGDGVRGRGVHCFDYAPERNLLCSCSIRREAIVWNPKAKQRLCTLEHRAPMVAVTFVERHSQLVTLSEDKVVKVWDLRMFRCMQTLTDKERRFPEDKYSSLGYDTANDAILCGAGVPVVWRDVEVQAKLETGISWHPDYEGHLNAIKACSYNARFGHVLSADDKHFHVWNVRTGRRLSKWSPFQGRAGDAKRITTACFDSDQRRLLTGSDDGGVSMWSLDGRLLKSFHGLEGDVTCVIHIIANEGQTHAQAYVAAGSVNCQCAVWVDSAISSALHRVPEEHCVHLLPARSPAHCIAFTAPNKLAVGTASGAVLLYNINNLSLMSENRSVVGSSFRRLKSSPRDTGDDSPGSSPRNAAVALPPREVSSLPPAATTYPSMSQQGSLPPRCTSAAGTCLVSVDDLPAAMPPAAAAPASPPRLWQEKVRSVSRLEARLDGAQEFTQFRQTTQMKLLTVTEALVFLPHPTDPTRSSDAILTLHGDGDALLWRLKDGYFLEIAACFPASYAAGEAAYSLAVDRESLRAYIGDGDAVISVFDLSHYIKHLEEERDRERRAPVVRTGNILAVTRRLAFQPGRRGGGARRLGSLSAQPAADATPAGELGVRATGSRRKAGKQPASRSPPRRQSRDMRGQRGDAPAQDTASPKCRRGPSGRIYHNRCRADGSCSQPLMRLVRCFDIGTGGAVTQISIVPNSPALIAASNDASITLLDRTTGQALARFGSVNEHPRCWPTGLPAEMEIPAVPMPISRPQRQAGPLPAHHRFTFVFPEHFLGTGCAEDALESLQTKSADLEAEQAAADIARRSPRARRARVERMARDTPPLPGAATSPPAEAQTPQLQHMRAPSTRIPTTPQQLAPAGPQQQQQQQQLQLPPSPTSGMQRRQPSRQISQITREETVLSEDLRDFDREMQKQADSVAKVNADRYERYLKRYQARAPASQRFALDISNQTRHEANEQVMHQLSQIQQKKRHRVDLRQSDYTLLRDYKLHDIPDDLAFSHSSPRTYPNQACQWVPPGQTQPERAGCRHCRRHRNQPPPVLDDRQPDFM
eukprot:TRINITY_DN1395_c5_g1_i1.p1 TRINITY_DN1395_c5_g1~~TRINITY_DN1395_c5_g1_i1.p1  ORF type:complete len:1570 (+),score=484.21 TRINITY_DN1395_c5_g1_i1:112-4710(+)